MPTILDHRGLPIQRAQLAEPQTARLAALQSEFDNHPSRGLTPQKLARILQDAERGDLIAQHELFQDMEEKDGHLFSVMQTRRQALVGLDFDIEPPPRATAAEKDMTAYAKEMLESYIESLLFDMTDGVGHGFAPLEQTWDWVEKQQLPVQAVHRPQSWFQLPQSPGLDRNELRLRDSSADGAQLWPFGWILHRHRARSGYVSRSGLFRVLAWPFLFKNFAVRDLADFLEIYGLPLRLGTYNTTATKEDKATLLRAVVGIGHDAAAIIPEGMAIDFKNAAQGDNKSFDAMIGLMERTMSKAALGGTLTSGEGEHGTQALGNVHNELRHDLRDADTKQLAHTLTFQVVYPVLALNKGLSDPRRCPRVVFDTQEPEDLKTYSDAVPKLASMGMRIPVSWAHDRLKIPVAADGEAVLSVPRPDQTVPPEDRQPPDRTPAKPARQELRVRLAAKLATTPTAEPDELDSLAAEMMGEWVETSDPMRAAIEQALATATSFDDFSQALESGLAQISPDQLVDLLARGTFAARIWGMLNAPKRPNA
jgi:phage gp29-like protein